MINLLCLNSKMERVTLAFLKALASTNDYDYKDHEYVSWEDAAENHDWKLLLIDEKYIAITLFSTVYFNINGLNKRVVDNQCHGGVTFKGKGEKIALPKNLINEIVTFDPNYKLHGWDYSHEPMNSTLIRPFGMVKIVPYKYMYYDLVNIIENIK